MASGLHQAWLPLPTVPSLLPSCQVLRKLAARSPLYSEVFSLAPQGCSPFRLPLALRVTALRRPVHLLGAGRTAL